MRDSGNTLLRLIDDILDFSKIESGKFEITTDAFDLAALIERVGDKLQPVALKRGVSLRLFVDPQLPGRLRGDPLRVEQILTNLTANAIKFSAGLEHRGRVDIRAERGDADRLRLSVADNGIGIAANAV
jgi:signal transduction histidine kinase